MVVQKQLNVIQQGTRRWNTWRTQHQQTSIDLSGADLYRANLYRADLSEANLIRADLSGADLSGANLSRANLSEANLSEANLSEANLGGANLGGANLIRADLSGANLSGANLSRANLSRAKVGWTILGNLDLRTVKGLETIQHTGPSTIGTNTLERSEGDIPETFLRDAGLSETFLTSARSLMQSPLQYYTCFISYSSKDDQFARQLHNDLRKEGVHCWFAPENMKIGDAIRHRIKESIRQYDKLLLILSEHSIASRWVAFEVERALNKEPQGAPNVLYPVRVDQAILTCTESWAQEIRSNMYIGNFENWTDPQKYDTSFQSLLRALNTEKKPEKS